MVCFVSSRSMMVNSIMGVFFRCKYTILTSLSTLLIEIMRNIQMVDLHTQYKTIKDEIGRAIDEVLETTSFIKGPQVRDFEKNLAKYLNANHVIGCGNGTDALQIALMALDLPEGSEIIVP